jgi:hypothetical protein
MRRLFVVSMLIFCACGANAQPAGPYTSEQGKFAVRFPGTPKVTSKTSSTDLGELSVTVATYATSDGNVYMVSYTVLPSAPKAQHQPMLFAGVRDAVKGEGKQTEDKEFAFGPDKLPGREFMVEKGRQRIKFRAILRDNRLYQIAVIGSSSFVGGKDAKQFFESFELTK